MELCRGCGRTWRSTVLTIHSLGLFCPRCLRSVPVEKPDPSGWRDWLVVAALVLGILAAAAACILVGD